jgi:NitT/TauT family transport system substrate-binding protein
MRQTFLRTFLTATLLTFALAPVFAKAKADQSTVAAAKPPILRVASLNGPSSIPMAALFETHPDLDGVASAFSVAASPDILLPSLLKGDVDMAVLPVNAASKVYAASKGALFLTAIIGEGMISLVTKDPAVTKLADLKGKTVHVAGQGATPEYLFRYLLAANSIPADVRSPEAVILDFSIPTYELPAALLSGKISYAVVPEPFSTVITGNKPAFRRAIDFQQEFAAAINTPGAAYPVTALVVRRGFALKYPETVRSFLKAMEGAVAWTNTHPREAGLLVEKHTVGLQATIAERAIPTSAFVFKSAPAARKSVEQLLGIFRARDPASIGGALPDSGFYFE